MTDKSPAPSYQPLDGATRLPRSERGTAVVENMRRSELETIGRRLEDADRVGYSRALVVFAQLLAGAGAGAWIAGDSSTLALVIVFGFAGAFFLGYLAARDERAESISHIRRDFQAMLDEYPAAPAERSGGGPG